MLVTSLTLICELFGLTKGAGLPDDRPGYGRRFVALDPNPGSNVVLACDRLLDDWKLLLFEEYEGVVGLFFSKRSRSFDIASDLDSAPEIASIEV